jgi:hypothetical protein
VSEPHLATRATTPGPASFRREPTILIRQTSQVPTASSGGVEVVLPGGVHVEEQAAVEDAEPAVGELAERGWVTDAAGTECLVVGAGTRRAARGAEGHCWTASPR